MVRIIISTIEDRDNSRWFNFKQEIFNERLWFKDEKIESFIIC